MIEYMMMYRSYRDVAKTMPYAERLMFLDAIMDYAFDGIPFPENLPPVVKNYLTLVKPTIDKAIEHSAASSEGGRKSAETRRKTARKK